LTLINSLVQPGGDHLRRAIPSPPGHPTQADSDGDDPDVDGDGIVNSADKARSIRMSIRPDSDGLGDVCDSNG
jgi:hypothetical protein